MKGYWIGFVNVKKNDEYKKYTDLAKPAIELHGGKFIARGGDYINLEGREYKRLVIVVFDSKKKALECYNSKEYKKALSFLNSENCERLINIVEGIN